MIPMKKQAKLNIKLEVGTNKQITFGEFENQIRDKLSKIELELNKDGSYIFHLSLQSETLADKIRKQIGF